jgi:hypothetical protein
MRLGKTKMASRESFLPAIKDTVWAVKGWTPKIKDKNNAISFLMFSFKRSKKNKQAEKICKTKLEKWDIKTMALSPN